MKEIWRDIKDYEGLYQISNFGRVKSLPRNGTISTERILKPLLTGRGYYKVTLSKHNKAKYPSIHRLVAEAFILNPDNLPQINHKDGNKTNNKVGNLEWCTSLENVKHSIYTGLRSDKGVNSSLSKFTEKDIIWIKKHYIPRSPIYGCTALAKRYNVVKSTISDIIRNNHYKNIGE